MGPYNKIDACVDGTLPVSRKNSCLKLMVGIEALRLAVIVRKRTTPTRSG